MAGYFVALAFTRTWCQIKSYGVALSDPCEETHPRCVWSPAGKLRSIQPTACSTSSCASNR